MNPISKVILGVMAGGLLAGLSACNPKPDSGLTVHPGVGIRDYFTVRSMPDGSIAGRDLAPTPRPREAITTDDYFGIKLEHIYAGGMLGREVGNIALIAEIGGIIPDGISCHELPASELSFHVSDQQSDNRVHGAGGCAFKSLVQINPLFRDSHATFDSVFITPPFRTGNNNLRLQFLMAQINDVELAREIASWVEDRTAQLTQSDVVNVNAWQQELIDIGFTGVNYILDYAAEPSYVFEMTTEFIPVETVEGAEPQNLLMGGDFVVVGMTDTSPIRGGLMASDRLIYDSGRLYWQESHEEYTDTPYIIFNVVRFSRFPGELPSSLALSQVNRAVRRGMSPEEVVEDSSTMILDLQDAHVMNETEGEMLLDLFEWYAEAATIRDTLDDGDFEADDIPLEWSDAPVSLMAGLIPLDYISEAADMMRTLEDRIYGNYGQTPGLRQEECVTLRALTQDLAESYRSEMPGVITAFENLQVRRLHLQRDGSDPAELDAITQVEPLIGSMITALPGCTNYLDTRECDLDSFPEPVCPALREAYIPE